jgi:hypothetical protein
MYKSSRHETGLSPYHNTQSVFLHPEIKAVIFRFLSSAPDSGFCRPVSRFGNSRTYTAESPPHREHTGSGQSLPDTAPSAPG